MNAYYASKISENMALTDEKFLICQNVPISRTGYQEYFGEELGLDEYHGKMIKVYRSPEQVFDPDAMASFEGKPVCNEHPTNGVNAENAGVLLKGIMRDIRRGEQQTVDGDEVLLADFIIYDNQLIDAIRNGKRDVSSGYTCEYIINPQGIIEQQKIRGNHAAVVTSGRAGSAVSIHDSKPQNTHSERRRKRMAFPWSRKRAITTNDRAVLLARFTNLVHDNEATPEEKAEVVEAVAEALLSPVAASVDTEPTAQENDILPAAQDTDSPPAKDNGQQPAATQDNQAVMDAVAALTDQVSKLADTVAGLAHPATADPLAQLEAELAGTDTGPAATDDDPAATGDKQSDMQTADGTPDEGQEPVGVVSNHRNALLRQIRAVKPAIAQIKDPKARRLVSDSLANAFRAAGTSISQPVNDGYVGIMQIQQQVAKNRQRVQDAAPKDQSEIGKSIRNIRNPHYKGNK